ncbi:unnamed protein product [Pseudo-nitzschia multistriata]|nr:unnamed protein product [Pseudo-nitzschia multistriata]
MAPDSVVVLSVYEEGLDQNYAASFAELFSRVIISARKDAIQLKIPEGFPTECLKKFEFEDVDLRNTQGEDGLSLKNIFRLFRDNEETIKGVLNISDKLKQMMRDMIEYFENQSDESSWKSENLFLEVWRAYEQNVSCVYGVFKDK